jgi:hypothetical protein
MRMLNVNGFCHLLHEMMLSIGQCPFRDDFNQDIRKKFHRLEHISLDRLCSFRHRRGHTTTTQNYDHILRQYCREYFGLSTNKS